MKFLALVILLYHTTLPLQAGGMKGPKEFKSPPKAPTLDSYPAWMGQGAVSFFQTTISPLDGPKSPSYPTGSAYGIQVLKKHGFLLGVVMTADRLIHEADQPLGPIMNLHGQDRFFDPSYRNDFWWFKPNF